MGINRGSGRGKEERENLSFFKLFQSADLSSECMRALPFNFMRNISAEDFSNKMVIRARWGSSWKLEVSKNPRFYYMEKRGWNQFMSDNLLGENEFVTFTHTGKMCFSVRIFEQDGTEIVIPRKLPKMTTSSGIKEEQGETSYKDVKKEVETCESMRRAELKVRKKNAEESKTSKKKKMMKMMKKCVPDFKITITKSYLNSLAIPRRFVEYFMLNESELTIHHSNRNSSWKVGCCLVRENRVKFLMGWPKLAAEYPLLVGASCTFKLIKPNHLLLVID